MARWKVDVSKDGKYLDKGRRVIAVTHIERLGLVTAPDEKAAMSIALDFDIPAAWKNKITVSKFSEFDDDDGQNRPVRNSNPVTRA